MLINRIVFAVPLIYLAFCFMLKLLIVYLKKYTSFCFEIPNKKYAYLFECIARTNSF